MIPKRIHYCWFGGNPLSELAQKCIESWKKYCPDYEIIEWNESNFDVTEHPFTKSAYEAKAWAFVSDYARLKVVYENGGFYLDTDVELLKSLDSLCENKCYFGIEQAGNFVATGLGFGGEKNHEVILEMLAEYDDIIFSSEKIKEMTCPVLNTEVLKKRGFVNEDKCQILDDIVVFSAKFFDPVVPRIKQKLLCDETFSVHHYAASWIQEEKEKNQLFKKLNKFLPFELAKVITSFVITFKKDGIKGLCRKIKNNLVTK